MTNALDPFVPGAGILPPYLAGREAEQSLFRKIFGRLREGRSLPDEVILYGPRGNGKTALLAWIEKQVEADDALDSVWLTPSEVPDLEALAHRLRVVSWFRRLSPESFSVAGMGVSFRPSNPQPLLTEALQARAKERPLLVLLDEAHTLEPGVGRVLLNAAQAARRHSPFLLVLAGTPDLQARLSKIEASFWGRARELPVGRLEEAAAAEAVRRPLAREGVEIEAAALDCIVRESHGYPFFLQVWGSAVWDTLHEALSEFPGIAPRASVAIVEAAAPHFEDRKGRYYRQRVEELQKRSLVPAARQVAAAFSDEPALSDSEIDEALRRGASSGGPDPGEARESLRHLGYIWRAQATIRWEPGIPSLMDYLLEQTTAPGRPA